MVKSRFLIYRTILFAILVLFGANGFAQEQDLNVQRITLEAKKKVQIAKYMQFTNQQDKDFWNIYANYERDMGNVYRRKFDMIVEFRRANEANRMTDNLAAKMLDEFFSIENEKLLIKQKYVKDFRKILPNKKVTLFYQIDNKLDAIVNHEIAMKLKLLE